MSRILGISESEMEALYPLWHSSTSSSTVSFYGLSSKNTHRYDFYNVTDYGGTGVDCSVDQSDGHVIWESLKCEVDSQKFEAKQITLPFMPPSKAKMSSDPCLLGIQEQNQKVIKFITMLQSYNNIASRIGRKKSETLELYKQLSELYNKGKDADVSVDHRIHDLAEYYPSDIRIIERNRRYTGNCLRFCNHPFHENSVGVLLHPGGKKFNTLVITPVFRNELQTTIEQEYVYKSELILQQKLPKRESIYEICWQNVNNSFLCGVRQKTNFTISSFDETNISELLCSQCDEGISVLSISPFILGEYFIMTDTGKPMLQTLEFQKPIWHVKQQVTSSCPANDPNNWLTGDFGSHPRGLLICDHKMLSLWDLRRNSVSPTLPILSTPSPYLINNEQLLVIEKHPFQPYQHVVATDHHLLLCDERFPREPVLSWNHMLKSPPTCCNANTLTSSGNRKEAMILTGSQETCQVACICIQNVPRSTTQPQSLSPPWHLCPPSNCINALNANAILKDNAQTKRLSMPLVGIAAISHSDSNGFTAFHLSSLGDIFFQDYRKSLGNPDKTQEISSGNDFFCVRNISDLNNWIDSVPKEITDPKLTLKRTNLSKFLPGILSQFPNVECTQCQISSRLFKKPKDSGNCILNSNYKNYFEKFAILKTTPVADKPMPILAKHAKKLKVCFSHRLDKLGKLMFKEWSIDDIGNVTLEDASSSEPDFIYPEPLESEEEMKSLFTPKTRNNLAFVTKQTDDSQLYTSQQSFKSEDNSQFASGLQTFNSLIDKSSKVSDFNFFDEPMEDDCSNLNPASQDFRFPTGESNEILQTLFSPAGF